MVKKPNGIMSEFFLELFSEEIPANLQKNTRKVLLQNFKDFFQKENISFNKCQSFSTPNRLLILFDGVKKELVQKTEDIRGPNVRAPEKALEGFLRSNKIEEKEIFKKKQIKESFIFIKNQKKKLEQLIY